MNASKVTKWTGWAAVLLAWSQLAAAAAPASTSAARFGKIPLYFEANRGQTDADIQFLARAAGHAVYLGAGEARLAFAQDTDSVRVVRLSFPGSNPRAAAVGVEKLPGRVNRVLDALAASELKMKVEVIDGGAIIDGLQKVANRITLGLILAAMIMSAALVMRIDTTFRILGYPGFAMILFTLAFVGAAYLAFQIIRHDRSVDHR